MNTQKRKPPAHGAPLVEAPLSPRLAFVVQFRTNSGGATQSYTGRAEHMTSGHVTHFRSQGELWTFLTRVLEEEQERKEQESRAHLRPDRLPDGEP
jgi:hypothetical protein